MAQVSATVNEMIGRLGVSAEVLGNSVGQLSRGSNARLSNLGVAYARAAMEANRFSAGVIDGRVELPPFLYNPAPREALAQRQTIVGGTYWQPTVSDRGSDNQELARLMDPRTRRAAMLQRLLNGEPSVQSAVGKVVGGTVVADSRTDGTVTMNPPGTAVLQSALTADPSGGLVSVGAGPVQAPTAPPSGAPMNLYQLLEAMDAAVMVEANTIQAAQRRSTDSDPTGAMAAYVNGPIAGSISLDDTTDDPTSGGTSSANFSAALTSPTASQGPFPENQLPQNTIGQQPESVDVGTAQLHNLITKRSQMYQLVSQVFQAYDKQALAAINNMKG